jgi:pimeloyl-ACP methyl ester carboxylesterase
MAVEKVKVGSSGVEIAFERFGDHSSPPVLLIMGAGAQMIMWPDSFCADLVEHGLQVIRFDNRDAGLSTHFNNAPKPDFYAVISGDFSTVSYSLSDMAADTVGLIDALGFEDVHIVGASLGGMIAQTIAIEYPARIKSLTSIMSTTGNPAVGQTDYSLFSKMGTPPWDDRQRYIEWSVNAIKSVASSVYPVDEEVAMKTAGLAWDRDRDPTALNRQAVAAVKSGDRTELLRRLNIPTLVMHGKEDRLIDPSGAVATAEAIPNAKLVLFDGLGHGLPKGLLTEMADLIANHVKNAELRPVAI